MAKNENQYWWKESSLGVSALQSDERIRLPTVDNLLVTECYNMVSDKWLNKALYWAQAKFHCDNIHGYDYQKIF